MMAKTARRSAPPASLGSSWFDGVFFDDLRILLDAADPMKANLEARFLMEKLQLKKGRRFLDCPCGIGRISLPLARAGVRVTGVDLTPSYLAALNGKAIREGLRLTLVHADMRRLEFDGAFDAVGNLGTSFGYFDNRADDLRTLRQLFRALKPGGRLALQTVNRDWILTRFEQTGVDQLGDTYIVHRRRFDYRASVLHIAWTFITDGRYRDYNVRLRLYSYHELAALLAHAGFVDVEGFGSVAGGPIDASDNLMWLFARKPK
jgi:SAM-dependent methyltransferase